MPSTLASPPAIRPLPCRDLHFSEDSLAIYGDPTGETDGLLESVRAEGVLVPLVVARGGDRLGGGLGAPPARLRPGAGVGGSPVRGPPVRHPGRPPARDPRIQPPAPQDVQSDDARGRRPRRDGTRTRHGSGSTPTCVRDRDGTRPIVGIPTIGTGRTDDAVALAIGIGGKDLYRQARAIWRMAMDGDPRARSGVAQLDAGTKTVHSPPTRTCDAATASPPGFRPTPYDVWSFKHDRAFGIPHPGSIPPAIVAHTLHYYSAPDALVVDPMAGGGTTLDVCDSMGRRCLAYDIDPGRPEIQPHDVRNGFPLAAHGCDLVFCDPPYHTMLARQYHPEGVANAPLSGWLDFLKQFARDALATLRPGGYLALLLANQTEKDLPAGYGYLDHAFYGYSALVSAGFLPERRISCPMDGAYRPQDVQRSRANGRMLGQVRDLIIVRKPMT